MSLHRTWLFVPLAALAGCQLLIGLDEGTLKSSGSGGSGGATASTTSTSTTGSTAGPGGGSSSTASAGGAGSSATSSGGTGGGDAGITLDLIDDMESGTGTILKINGRSGSWFSYNDGTGMQTPTPGSMFLSSDIMTAGGDVGSLKARYTNGTGFKSWGAGIGFDLNHPNAMVRQVYDASMYSEKGLVFWARSDHPMPVPPLYVRILESQTVSPAEGGECMQADGGPSCGDSHSTTVLLTSSWKMYQIPFSSFSQGGWGVPSSPKDLDTTKLLAVQFAVENAASFDYWIDDVSFYQ